MRDFAANGDIYMILPLQSDRSPAGGTDELPLLREMHHRMANTLTLLSAQLWNEFGSSKAPQVRRSLNRFEARIAAFGQLHHLLAVGARDRRVAVRSYVEELCRALSEAVLTPLGIRCEVSVDDGILASGTGERLGLVITELVTNAAKHAFSGLDGGTVRVELTSKSDRWLCTVSDNGTGIVMPLSGSGAKILDDIAHMIGGTLVLQSGVNGTSVSIAFAG
jgi:two-component sensor histidine kinase